MGIIVEACWKGYKQVGLKKKGDRMVPNCVSVNENINVPIKVGDTVLGGKFKNKRIVIKSVDKNEKGDITINGKPLLKIRIIQEGKDVIGIVELGCAPRRKGESESDFKRRCSGRYTYAFPLYMTSKKQDEPQEPTTPPVDSETPAIPPAAPSGDVSENENSLSDLEKKLKSHDWWYAYSDDNRKYTNGRANWFEITKMIRGMKGNKEAEKLWNKYVPKDFNYSFKELSEETNEDLRKWFGKGKTGSSGGGGWDRYGSDGQNLGKCGGGDDGDAYAACLSKEKAAKLGPKGRAAFVRRKRGDQKKAGDSKKGGESSKGQKPTMSKTGA